MKISRRGRNIYHETRYQGCAYNRTESYVTFLKKYLYYYYIDNSTNNLYSEILKTSTSPISRAEENLRIISVELGTKTSGYERPFSKV